MTPAPDPYQPLNLLKVSGNLPVIPQILVQLIDLCGQEDIDLQAVARLVKKDAALAAKVLQLCNSAFIGARSAFADVTQAVVYLGADTVRNLAISVSVQQVFRRVESNGLLNIDRFWYHSYENAILAQRIAEATGYTNPSEAYLAGLVHDLGKLLMWMAFPGKYAPLLLKGIRCQGGRLAFLEQEKLHINHCDAGAWLLKQWGLPSLIGDAVRYHHHPVDDVAQALALTRIVYLADLLSHSEDPEQECNEVAAKLFRLAPGKVNELLEGVDDQIHEVARRLGIRIPSATKSALEPEEMESKKIHKQTSQELISRVRDTSQLCGHLQNLLRAGSANQILATLEESLLILFNLEPALVLLLTDDKTRMQACTSPKNKLADQVQSLNFTIAHHDHSLPVQCLVLGQLLHSFMARPDMDPTMLDSQIISLLGSEGMILIPLQAGSERIGVLILGVSKNEHLNIISQSDPLLLLASQAGMAIHMQALREREAQRKTADQLKGAATLARRIAHEINNPVAILQNYLKVLEQKLKDNGEIQEELRIMAEECGRIGTITSQLQDITGSEQVSPDKELDLNTFLAKTIQLYEAGQDKKGKIHFHFQPAAEPIILTTDENALRQIITNLITNALDAVAGEGTVSIEVEAGEQDHHHLACIRVCDDGPGLDPAVKDTLFQAGTTTKGGGHGGLGLAIVSNLVRHLGGTVEVAEQDGNTIFSITLPFSPH
jgi:HD-like signal output (HDOD) protein/signal transduction histidine kinase